MSSISKVPGSSSVDPFSNISGMDDEIDDEFMDSLGSIRERLSESPNTGSRGDSMDMDALSTSPTPGTIVPIKDPSCANYDISYLFPGGILPKPVDINLLSLCTKVQSISFNPSEDRKKVVDLAFPFIKFRLPSEGSHCIKASPIATRKEDNPLIEKTPITALRDEIKKNKGTIGSDNRKYVDNALNRVTDKKISKENKAANAKKINKIALSLIDKKSPSQHRTIDLKDPGVHIDFIERYYEDNSLFGPFYNRTVKANQSLDADLFKDTLIINLHHVLELYNGTSGGHVCTKEMIEKGEVTEVAKDPVTGIRIGKRNVKTLNETGEIQENIILKSIFPEWVVSAKDIIDLVYGSEFWTNSTNGPLLCYYPGSEEVSRKPFFFQLVKDAPTVVKTLYPLFSMKYIDDLHVDFSKLEEDGSLVIAEAKEILQNYINSLHTYQSLPKDHPLKKESRPSNPLKHFLETEADEPLLVIDFAPKRFAKGEIEYSEGCYYTFPKRTFSDLVCLEAVIEAKLASR